MTTWTGNICWLQHDRSLFSRINPFHRHKITDEIMNVVSDMHNGSVPRHTYIIPQEQYDSSNTRTITIRSDDRFQDTNGESLHNIVSSLRNKLDKRGYNYDISEIEYHEPMGNDFEYGGDHTVDVTIW